MALKSLITEAVKRVDDEDALRQVLARLPRRTPESVARILLHVVEHRSLPLAVIAAKALTRIPDGQGQVFILEALATLSGPSAQRAEDEEESGPEGGEAEGEAEGEAALDPAEAKRRELLIFALVAKLDLEALGHAWPRLRWVMTRSSPQGRLHICQRLGRQPQIVPPRQWAALVKAATDEESLGALVDAFGRLLSLGDSTAGAGRRLQGLLALGEALLDRFDDAPGTLTLRQTFCHNLARSLSQGLSTRRLMVLLDRVQRSELRRAFLSEMRPLLDDADAALDDDEVLRVLFTRRASWLQQQRFSRTPYKKLTEAINSGRRRAVDEALDQLPLPPTADLGRPLLEVIQRMDDDLALRAAELLATVRHGQGAVFLMEALLTPSLRVAPALIELLDFEVMGTAWIRLPTVLRALDSAPRQQLIQRLVDNHARVPAWRWESAVLACNAAHDMPLILRHFQSLLLRTLRQEHIEEINPIQALRALSDALTRRLALTPDDPPELQAAIAELLVEDAARDTTAARRLLQVLEQTTSASLRHVLLLQLLRRVDVLASHLVDESVAVLVHIAERRQEPFTSIALSCLRYLASLGNPIAWEPLLQCPGSEPRNVVMRALSRQESDISAALSDVLAAPDPAIRRSAASLIGRRLARGRAIRDEVLSAFAARIAQDPDGSVAQGLDVHTLFHFAPPQAARAVALAVLKTPHPALLDRALKALGDNALRQRVLSGGSPDALCTHLAHLCAHPHCKPGSRRFDAVLRLLSAPDLPPQHILDALEPLLAALPLDRVDLITTKLAALPVALWQAQCTAYQALRTQQPSDAVLDLMRDWGPKTEAWLLRPALTHTDRNVRIQALMLAKVLAHPDLLPDLLDALSAASDPHLTLLTAKALVASRHLGALPSLEALAAHPDCPPRPARPQPQTPRSPPTPALHLPLHMASPTATLHPPKRPQQAPKTPPHLRCSRPRRTRTPRLVVATPRPLPTPPPRPRALFRRRVATTRRPHRRPHLVAHALVITDWTRTQPRSHRRPNPPCGAL